MNRCLRVILSLLLCGWFWSMTGVTKSQASAQVGHQYNHSLTAFQFNSWHWRAPFVFANVVPELDHVIPCVHTIGIKLPATGILVVGYHLTHRGKTAYSPAEQAHVQVGDVIVAVNGQRVSNMEQVARYIDSAGAHKQSLILTIKRKGEQVQTSVCPALDEESGSFRLGMFIRDSASGVGTLTFYLPQSHFFGALGHVIADTDTGQPIEGHGQVVHASVTSIDRGESGQPGLKRGQFVNDHQVLGEITLNTDFGVFGTMKNAPDHGLYAQTIPLAHAYEVHPGPAKMLTVLSNQQVQSFDVTIVKVSRQDTAQVKGMVIRVTDPVLLSRTGGIVQGMSGSPILQDGKLAGAVTHVFVSDPTQGFGIYAEWMVKKAEQNRQPTSLNKIKSA